MSLRQTTTVLCVLLAVLTLLAVLSSSSLVHAGPNCDSTGAIDSDELQLLELINNYRGEHGLQPLVLSHSLDKAAAWKAANIPDRFAVSHDDTQLGRTWVQRIRDCGYTFNVGLGENIAGGDPSPAGAFDIWRHSPDHDGIMLADGFRAIGIGRAQDANGYWYWVADFGGQLDAHVAGGDVNCDGHVDTVDASLILQHAAGLLDALDCQTEADADSSGSIDATDALLVLQYAAGLLS